jgi:hypothetical protein
MPGTEGGMKKQVLVEGDGIVVTSTHVEIDGEIVPLGRITSVHRKVVRAREFSSSSPFAVLAFALLAIDLMVLILSCADALGFTASLWFLGASLVIVPVLFLLASPARTSCALRLGQAGKQDRVIRGEDADLFEAAYQAINATITARG